MWSVIKLETIYMVISYKKKYARLNVYILVFIFFVFIKKYKKIKLYLNWIIWGHSDFS
jgi:hypothetical protein